MAIITFTRVLGSHGEEIARAVAKKLNYNYIDKPELAVVLEELGLPVDETFFQKGPTFLSAFSQKQKKSSLLVAAAIAELAKKGDAVIFGWGAQVLLQGLGGVFRVRVVATPDVRQQRLMVQNSCDQAEADKILTRSDRDSARYVSSIFGVDWEAAGLYDLVINTDTISVDLAAELIVTAAASIESQESTAELADLAIRNKAQAALLDVVGAGAVNLKVENGVAELSGMTDIAAAVAQCESALSKISGISRVDNEIRVIEDNE